MAGKPVARQGDKIVHWDGSTSTVLCLNALNVLVQGVPIATEGDVCSLHGGPIKSSLTNVFAGPKNSLVAVNGDIVTCPTTMGLIVIDDVAGRTVVAGN